MKLNGKKIEGPNIELIFIPRADKEPIVLKAQAVTDYEAFKKLCPEPKPPKAMKPGRIIVQNTEDPEYKKAMEEHSKKRLEYMILQSLSVTEGLEWETVNLGDASTWGNYEAELRASGFSDIEIQRIVMSVLSANGLDDAKVEQARNRFLASQRGEDEQ
jgi:hypothetical protein